MSLKYRPEIDGLRAIAVMIVIFFHAGFSIFSGGFVGVDVFFVLSGYLISSIILKETAAETFSLINFYERRARRILPALFLVMLLCLPFAWLYLLPKAMEEFSKSLVAVSTFISNILFWRESGYFSAQADLKPLLHTWTLSVEEQFYVFLPLFIMLTGKVKNVITYVLLGLITLSSLALSQIGSHISPTAAFYLLPTRAWELFIGVIIGYYLSRRTVPPKGSNALSLLGLIMILAAVFLYNKSTPFPSVYALLPTLGTALIVLFTDKTTLIYKFLSLKLMVGLGLISYSLYLWHQPVFAFAKHASLHELSLFKSTGLILLSTLGAFLSWKFVERPFRNNSMTSRKQIFLFSLLGSLAFIAIGLFGVLRGGDLGRFDTSVKAIASTSSGALKRCNGTFRRSGCQLGADATPPSIAVIGDSHSAALQKALDAKLLAQNQSALSFSGSWCVPLLGVHTKEQYRDQCLPEITKHLNAVLSDPKINTVILVAEWANYTQGHRWGVEGTAYYEDKETTSLSLGENSHVLQRGLSRTVERLKAAGKDVILVKSVPEYKQHVPNYLAKSLALSGETNMNEFELDKTAYQARNAEVETVFNKLDLQSKINFIDTYAILCPNDICQYISDTNAVLYSDDNHLSPKGAELIINQIFKQ